MNENAQKLRERLKAGGVQIGAGVHDAITAKLAEQCGFHFVWISGLGLSTVSGVPDASLLTLGDFLPAFGWISQAVEIPVIADCDNGYGDTANAVFTAVQIRNRTRLAGICIEDNPYPKRNSLMDGQERKLVSVEEMVAKISGIREAVGDDLFLIARCESLIAGFDIDTALRRAEAYAEAGADAILIHSKDKTGQQAETVGKLWRMATPLVSIPTMFPHLSADELHRLGYSMVIYANQPMRAAVKASAEALRALKEGRAGELEREIVELSHLFDLTSLPYLSPKVKVTS